MKNREVRRKVAFGGKGCYETAMPGIVLSRRQWRCEGL